ncbi:MAG: phytoene desaturase family protein, partial [Flavipsychrobacter sp.]
GLKKKLPRLQHHNLFFDTDFEQHARDIYAAPRWPQDPLFYVCCPSKTDSSVAPENCENLFILIPIAPGLNDDKSLHPNYFNQVISRLEAFCGQSFKDDIVVNRSYGINDFITDYNAFKGNAYGLANTLRQTAVLKPAIRNKKISNLYYAGQLTVPGPGLPPSLISGEIVAAEIIKHAKNMTYESALR